MSMGAKEAPRGRKDLAGGASPRKASNQMTSPGGAKGTAFLQLTARRLQSYIRALGNTPRKRLNCRTSAEVFRERPVALEV